MREDCWRLLRLTVDSYAEATMSLSPAIAQACTEGDVPETLAIYTHLRPSVVMGRQNDPEVDIDYEFCRTHGIIVKRVPTPGTIFGHPGYIMNALYIRRERLPRSISDIFAMINTHLASALTEKWGLPARHRPLNDLEVRIKDSWKKVGPFSISFFGPTICCRMGMTITPVPIETVERAIPGPPEKFADKEEKSVSQRVGSLEEALERPLDIREVSDTIKIALSNLFQVDLVEGEVSEKERLSEEKLKEKYDNEEWFWANSLRNRFPDIPAGARLDEHTEKISHGPLIRARVLRKGTEVIDCSLTGWYHGVRPLDALERIEQHLKAVSCKEHEIRSRIQKAWDTHKIEIGNCSPSDISRVVLAALQ